MRILGLDIGDRRIGMAVSDPDGILASPLTIVNRTDTDADIAAIVKIANRYQVGRIIAGLPRKMDGSLGAQAEKTLEFVRRLSGATEIAVESRDERLTTAAARRLMNAARTKKTRQKAGDDAFAAAVILQGYLDER